MVEPVQVGHHWVLVITRQDGAGWQGVWAVYPNRAAAIAAGAPEPDQSLVSGTTATFETESAARYRALLDGDRSAAVISGTYRA